jgi:hypothetical protein
MRGVTMKELLIAAVAVGMLSSLPSNAQTRPASAGSNIEPLPRDLEVQLALSALPPHLRDRATVYVLNPAKGFDVARQGTNGFHAFVARTGDDAMRGAWSLAKYPDDVLYPISFDGAGAKAQMRVFFDIAEMQAKGVPSTEVKTSIQGRYKTGMYKAPERPGVSYMLSPIVRTYVEPEKNDTVATQNIPHVMYFAPNVSNEDVGGAVVDPSSAPRQGSNSVGNIYPFVILHGPHGYNIQLLGKTETAAITKEYEPMLARLCKIKSAWCLATSKTQ